MSEKKVVITGATGFIGSHLAHHFESLGWEVVRLGRASAISTHRYSLQQGASDEALAGARALIHCAYAAGEERLNIEGTKLLLSQARKHGIGKFVFLSSYSAHEGALSVYGKQKLAIEKILDPTRDLIIRPGLVIGNGGVFAAIRDSIRRIPIVPLFGGGRQPLQTIAVNDLCRMIGQLVLTRRSGLFALAETKPVAIAEFYRELARQMRIRAVFIPFPLLPALCILKLCEKMELRLPVSSESLLGLKQLRALAPTQDEAIAPPAQAYRESLSAFFAKRDVNVE